MNGYLKRMGGWALLVSGNVLTQQLAKLGMILMMGVSMSACSSTMKWKEEVKLHDGQVIVAERFYNLGGYPTIQSRERSALDHTVTFMHPTTGKKIIWKTDFRDSEPVPNSLNLFLLDVVNGVPYIATYPAGCIAYNKWKRPNPPQVLFKYENDQWKRISLAEFPAELSKANVIVGKPATSLLKNFYSAEAVDMVNYDISTPEYKTILREEVPNAGGSCPTMIRTGNGGNGGWISLDWFMEQPSYEACMKVCALKQISTQDCPCSTLPFKGK